MSVQNQKTIFKYINKQNKEIERLNNKIEKNRKFIIKIINELIIPCYNEERLKKYMNIDNKYVLDSILKYYDSYSMDEYLQELKGDSNE